MAKLKLTLSMLIFGTIGLFVNFLSLPSGLVALTRGAVGSAFILLALILLKKRPSGKAIKNNLWLLICSGGAIGINWILLFEAYKRTGVALGTLCYYLAPVFVVLASPIVLREKLTAKKIVCVLLAMVGMAAVCGVFGGGADGSDAVGMLFGVGAAVFCASVILMNKFLKDISAYDSTLLQRSAATVTLAPYVIFSGQLNSLVIDGRAAALLAAVGIIHTGVAYCLYFSSMADLPSQTIALYSYIDPAFALILSAVVLKEKLTAAGIAGAFLILGSTLFSELTEGKKTEGLSD